jgi:tripartite-type tricarboxylate transporter receptor subunit TctC
MGRMTRLLLLLPVLALADGGSTAVSADSYPSQEIHFICAFPAGSGADVLVRYVAEKIRPLAGKPVLVGSATPA